MNRILENLCDHYGIDINNHHIDAEGNDDDMMDLAVGPSNVVQNPALAANPLHDTTDSEALEMKWTRRMIGPLKPRW